MDVQEAIKVALDNGFTYASPMDVSNIELLQEVRDMCEVNTCGMYGKNWACPPGCGTLDECRAKVAKYSKGIIVQTVGDIEDSLDFEAIMEIGQEHGEHFQATMAALKKETPDMLSMGAGGCNSCSECTYPDNPCRLPDKLASSMEAHGIFVNDLCTKCGLKYNYGPEKMAYTSCYLFN